MVALDPSLLRSVSAQQRLRAAELFTLMGVEDVARQLYASMEGDDPWSAAMGQGMLAMRAGDAATAVSWFERALSERPDDYEALLALGYARLAQSEPAEALAHFTRAERQRPGAASAQTALGRAWAAQGDFVRAEACLRRAVGLDGRDVSARLDLARSIVAQGRARAALTVFEEALADAPGQPSIWREVAGLLASLGGVEPAAELLELGAQVLPEEPELLHAAATLELRLGRRERALEKIERLASLVEETPAQLTELGRLALAAGDVQRAGQWADRATRLDPSFAPAHHLLARLFDLVGEDTLSFQAHVNAAGLAPEDWRYLNDLAAVLVERGDDHDLAQVPELLDRAEAAGGPRSEILFNRGLWARRSGDPATARYLFGAAVEADSGDVAEMARRARAELDAAHPGSQRRGARA